MAAAAPERRYVLCDGYAAPPSARLGYLGHLRVFAASLAANDLLRTAFFVDSPGNWTVALPSSSGRVQPFAETVRELTHYDAARMTGIHSEDFASARRGARLARFAKCFGRAVAPRLATASCEVGEGLEAPGWPPPRARELDGRVQLFDNGELRHNFVRCSVRNPGTAPARLRAGLHLRLFSGPAATVHFELCRVDEPWRPLSFCTLPLYGLSRLKAAIPGILDGWLAYHFGHVGFARAEVYDTDGSFADDLAAWRLQGYDIGYHARWAAWLSPELGELSREHPGCAESFAYAHCLTMHRALSRWVMLLHGPDEYVRIVGGGNGAGRLPALVQRLSATAGHHVGTFTVHSWPFARGGTDLLGSNWGAGAVLAASRLRSSRLDVSMHTPLLDPERCTCAGPHSCTAEKGYLHGNVSEVGENVLVTHHYLEMLPWDEGRCGRLNGGLFPCEVPDSSLVWAAEMLRTVEVGTS